MVADERYASNTTDFRGMLTNLIGADPNAIHISAQSEFTGGNIMKQIRELGYEGPLYGEIVAVGSTALEIAGDAATGMKAIIAELLPTNQQGVSMVERFQARYGYAFLLWYMGSAYDDVFITAECLKQTKDDQDAAGFRDCLYQITYSGTIGDNYSFDAYGEVVGISNAVIEILPLAERNLANQGYKVLGAAPRLE